MEIRELQRVINERWSRQLGNPCHKSADPDHALLHLTKALGKVASAVNDAKHEERSVRQDEVEKYLADLVICSMRFAHGVGLDLSLACGARVAEKFPVGADSK
jgi:NTP pyrophosphatase (non-canonical NTP hydrolase)